MGDTVKVKTPGGGEVPADRGFVEAVLAGRELHDAVSDRLARAMAGQLERDILVVPDHVVIKGDA